MSRVKRSEVRDLAEQCGLRLLTPGIGAAVTCSRCYGQGNFHQCPECNGSGRLEPDGYGLVLGDQTSRINDPPLFRGDLADAKHWLDGFRSARSLAQRRLLLGVA